MQILTPWISSISSALSISIVNKTANYTLVVGTDYRITADATAGNIVITLPQWASTSGSIFSVIKIDATANTVTLTPISGLINGATTKVISAQYTNIVSQSNGTNYFIE